jgi:hypothetical protein
MECRIEFARVEAVIISSSGVFSEGALASPIDFWQLWAGWHQTDVCNSIADDVSLVIDRSTTVGASQAIAAFT